MIYKIYPTYYCLINILHHLINFIAKLFTLLIRKDLL